MRTLLLSLSALFLVATGCHESTEPVKGLAVAVISIDGGSRAIARGSDPLLTTTARSTTGDTITIPVAWRSSNEAVASIDRDGRLVTHDTGLTVVTASALGVTSQPVQYRIVVVGAASIAAYQFQAPASISPGGAIGDSIRVLVTTESGAPAVGATVKFAVTVGGGTVSPALGTVGASGLASTRWLAGPVAGRNTATATVVDTTGAPITYVRNNPVSFTASSYAALAIVRGDGQTGQVLSTLSITPAVKLVDSTGAPRRGVPITFSPGSNGSVAAPVVSTGADGVASPGNWTLGDQSGAEVLVVTVEGATMTLRATATGNVIPFTAARVTTAQAATCALGSDQLVRCLGQWPQNGTGDTPANQSTPTTTKGNIHFSAVSGGSAHFCGIATDQAIYCWGINAIVDSSRNVLSTGTPTRFASTINWQQVSPGSQHTCALATGGAPYCWGVDTDGQLGDNGTTTQFAPQSVSGGFVFTAITSGAAHSCGITADSAAFCWGANASGQIGDGTFATRRTPTSVGGGIKWRAIGGGSATTCGLAADSTAYCWGANTGKQVPGSYTGAPKFASLAVGAAHQCALTSAGVAYCWGDNSGGQLGDSTTTARTTPTLVTTTFRFASISAGTQHTCGTTLDGKVACWGRNQSGELGFTQQATQLTPRYIVLGSTP